MIVALIFNVSDIIIILKGYCKNIYSLLLYILYIIAWFFVLVNKLMRI
jgi:hypothetical protein